MDNKNIFAANLRKHMEANGKSRSDISEALNVSYFTVSDWVNGKKYPRMDKVELLANFFGIQKSDLIEDKQKTPPEKTPADKVGETVVIYHRDGKTVRRELTPEQMKMLASMIDAIPEEPKGI